MNLVLTKVIHSHGPAVHSNRRRSIQPQVSSCFLPIKWMGYLHSCLIGIRMELCYAYKKTILVWYLLIGVGVVVGSLFLLCIPGMYFASLRASRNR
jgi:hypothetical protein